MLVQGSNRCLDVTGSWNEDANAWISDVVELHTDCYLEIDLPSKGRLVVKKAETIDSPWPKAMVSKWADQIRLRIYGSTEGALLKFCLTDTPKRIQLFKIERG